MRQHVSVFGAELFAPPGPLGLPALNSSTVQPDKTKVPLLRPGRHVLRLGPILGRRWLKRLAGTEQQERADQRNQSNAFCGPYTLQSSLPPELPRTSHWRHHGTRSSRQHRLLFGGRTAWSGMGRQGGPLRTSAGVPVNVALRVHPETSDPVEKRHCPQAAALRWRLASFELFPDEFRVSSCERPIVAKKRHVKSIINLEQSSE